MQMKSVASSGMQAVDITLGVGLKSRAVLWPPNAERANIRLPFLPLQPLRSGAITFYIENVPCTWLLSLYPSGYAIDVMPSRSDASGRPASPPAIGVPD